MLKGVDMSKYRKKPVVIEAVQWNGNNHRELLQLGLEGNSVVDRQGSISIVTLEGVMSATKGDWIIKGVKGEFYPCKPGIFEMTYEKEN